MTSDERITSAEAVDALMALLEHDDCVFALRMTGEWDQAAFARLADAMERVVVALHGRDAVPAAMLPVFFNLPRALETVTSHPDFVRIQATPGPEMDGVLEAAWRRLRHLQAAFFNRALPRDTPVPESWPGRPR